MIKRETYGAYNICVERLLNPATAPRGQSHWHGYPLDRLHRQLPFALESPDTIHDESDFIRFGEVFDYKHLNPDEDYWPLEEFDEFLRQVLQLRDDCLDAESEEVLLLANSAKYPLTLPRVLRGVVGEDMAFGFQLPYLVEAESDFLAAFSLMGNGFGKPALQLLRSSLEVGVAHG